MAAIVDEVDFDRLTKWSWRYQAAGYASRAERRNGKLVSVGLHREVLGLAHDDPRDGDHRNRDRLDCRRDNLRIATRQQNMANRKPREQNTSGFQGVTWHRASNKWRAFIKINYVQRHLGMFVDKAEAARAYDAAARDAFGEFASLNFAVAT